MPKNWGWVGAILTLVVTCPLLAVDAPKPKKAEVTQAEFDALKTQLDDLKKRERMTTPVGRSDSPADEALERKYGPDAKVTTREGKLTIGGLIQVWYYGIQNDNHGWVEDDAMSPPGATTQFGSNEVADNDSFRVRRAELSFTMDIHPNVTAVIMIDPAREAISFPSIQQNTSNVISGDGVANFNVGAVDTNGDGTISNSEQVGNFRNDAVRTGAGSANRMLQDAYITFHNILPRHNVTVGQFKRHLGEEGTRDSGHLDLVERTMITQLADMRDLGFQVHGRWWDDRFQYWLGVFDGAGTAFQQRQNRSDDNDQKDWVASFLVRPVWENPTWGSLEIGASIMHGIGGESGGHFPANQPVDGLNRHNTVHQLTYAWLAYMPGGPVRGWWMRGEWGQYRDRFAPFEPVTGHHVVTVNPAPFNIDGWSITTGYHLGKSVWKDKLPSWSHGLELVLRYDVMENLFHHDLTLGNSSVAAVAVQGGNVNRQLDVAKTQVMTVGFNYYIKGQNAKIQFNYNRVDEASRDQLQDPNQGGLPPARPRLVREVANDSFVFNFQVGW